MGRFGFGVIPFINHFNCSLKRTAYIEEISAFGTRA